MMTNLLLYRTDANRIKRLAQKIWILAITGFIALCVGCTPQTAGPKLTIFAASSLNNAFTELAAAYEAQNPKVTIQLNFAGSSQLAAQISEGAPADIFASADSDQMNTAVASQRIDPEQIIPFLTNQLTIIAPLDNPANLMTLNDLAQTETSLILAAPNVPIRTYADQVIGRQTSDIQQNIYANLVSEEDNVRQIVAKIALGEADAGIVYISDITPDISSQVTTIPLNTTQNVTATYPIARLNDTPNPEEAHAFIQFILSPDGQDILRKWGFAPLDTSAAWQP